MEIRGDHFKRSLFLKIFILSLLLLFIVLSAVPAIAASGELPLTRAILFKNGIGFFEHEGKVKDQETVRISITSSQLDDVLKSLTVLDMDGGFIGAISYGSSAPLERQLKELETGDLRGRDLASMLSNLTGTSLEADAPEGKVSGRLLNAEVRKVTGSSGIGSEVIELALYTDEGQLRIVTLQSLRGLRFASDSTRQDLSRFLDVVEKARNDNTRTLEIKTLGSGERSIKLSYIVEAPIWKATYRLILGEGKPAFLQGWAIVDNTTSSDWNNVNLSLVSSSPVSFIHRLSEPVYASRPEVPVLAGPQVAPELHESGMEADDFGAAGMPEMAMEQQQKAARMGARTFAAPMSAPGATFSEALRNSNRTSAEALKVGDQFEYRMAEPVTLRMNQSALIPILQAEIEAEKISVFTSRGNTSPRNAVWLKNGTEFTLDGGPFSINDSGLFAGEGLFDTVYPGERRLLSYALDRSVTIEEDVESSSRAFQGITRERGILVVSHKLLEDKVYRIKNNADSDRNIVIEHPLRNGWNLVSPPSPEEKSGNYYRFKIEMEQKSDTRFTVQEERIVSQRISLDSITENEIRVWMSGEDMDDETRGKLAPLISLAREIAESRRRISSLDSTKDSIYSSQNRVRQNLSALGSSAAEAGLRQRYVSQMEEQEDQLEGMDRQLNGEKTKLDQLQSRLSEMVASIRF